MRRNTKREQIKKLEDAMRQIIKFTRECSDPDGWLAFNVRFAAEGALCEQDQTAIGGGNKER
jgi:hypothetical protein